MDFFDDMFDFLDCLVNIPGELMKATTELTSDVAEAAATEVKNKVLGNPDEEIQTSYDIRDKADGIITESNRKFALAKDTFISIWDKMIAEVSDVAKERKNVYSLVGQAIHSKQLTALPSSSEIVQNNPSGLPQLDTFKFDFGTYIGIAGIGMRMETAEEYLAAAEKYRIETMNAISKIHQLTKIALGTSMAHEEELKMLKIIKSSYETRSEAILIQSTDLIYNIAVLCLGEVSEQTNSKYLELLQKLKNLWA